MSRPSSTPDAANRLFILRVCITEAKTRAPSAIQPSSEPLIGEITYHHRLLAKADTRRDAVISANQCRECSSDCAARARGCGVSPKRAALLAAMSECWNRLAELTQEYEDVRREEGDAGSD